MLKKFFGGLIYTCIVIILVEAIELIAAENVAAQQANAVHQNNFAVEVADVKPVDSKKEKTEEVEEEIYTYEFVYLYENGEPVLYVD